MKHKVILPAAACAALPLLWAVAPSGDRNPACAETASAPAHGVIPGAAAEPAPGLAPLVQAEVRGERVALPGNSLAAPEANAAEASETSIPVLPGELRLEEIAPELAARLNSRLALFDEPTDGMYASWYAGASLEDLARVHFDGAVATQALAALDWSRPDGRAAAAAFGLGNLMDHQASFTKEVIWLQAEVNRRMELPRSPVTVALASKSDEDLMRAFPAPADRYVLGMLLRREYNELARDAARSEFAKVRAMSPEERSKHAMPVMT